MANPTGANGSVPLSVSQPYGEALRSKELLREAPISGAPFSGRALASPARAQDAAKRPPVPPAGVGASIGVGAGVSDAPVPAPVAPGLLAEAGVHAWASQLLTVPGISPLVAQYAQQIVGSGGQ